jgi:hypothetical protein|tara:strand:- start:4447 stop:4650 length:204 start_codon:yes stop_codon:yes gene_type:complete
MTTKTQTPKTPNRLGYEKYGSDVEYITHLEALLLGPLVGLEMLEGDLYMSDYRSLIQAKWLIENKDK